MAYSAKIMLWIYPSSTDIGAMAEIADGRDLWAIKPEYFTVGTDGVLTRLDASNPEYAFGGYSYENAMFIKRHSTHQFITVSCNNWTTKGDVLCSDGTKRANAIATMLELLDTIGFDGIELDFEPFGNTRLSSTQYANYKTFIIELGNALHANGYELMLDGPSVNAVDSPFLPNLYRLKYNEMDSLPIDYIVSMSYDSQWNYPTTATNSVAPTGFIENCCDYMKTQIRDIKRTVMGMGNYGYYSTENGDSSDLVIATRAEVVQRTGYGTATRNADNEMTWVNGGVRSLYQDEVGLDAKRAIIEAKGIRFISVWVGGGNSWFPGTEPPARVPATRAAASRSSAPVRTSVTRGYL
jgi:spore germination protein YaaH